METRDETGNLMEKNWENRKFYGNKRDETKFYEKMGKTGQFIGKRGKQKI